MIIVNANLFTKTAKHVPYTFEDYYGENNNICKKYCGYWNMC